MFADQERELLPPEVRARTVVMGAHLICQERRMTGAQGHRLPVAHIVIRYFGGRIRNGEMALPTCQVRECIRPTHLQGAIRCPQPPPVIHMPAVENFAPCDQGKAELSTVSTGPTATNELLRVGEKSN